MKIKVLYILLLMLTVSPKVCHAQRMDYLTLEALIADHKQIRGPIQQRAALETVNQELHDTSREKVLDYKDVNDQLDKYTRCFDILDIVYNSLSVSMNVYTTAKDISNKLVSIKDLLERYRACIIMKQLGKVEEVGQILSGVKDISSISGAAEWLHDASNLYENSMVIVPEDTIIFVIGRDMIKDVGDKSGDIYKSFVSLVGYATGALACTTEGLLSTIQGLDQQLTDLRKIVDNGHFLLWRYIHMRTGYWSKSVLHQQKSVREHARNALERWRRATYGKLKNKIIKEH